jgi:DNA modification methylase
MTELVWEGKYDEAGRKVAPLRVALPFQTVETVNESAQVRTRMMDLWASGRETEWRNRLIWGDKKYVLPSLLDEFAGKVDLIYIDPPFDTGADFSFEVHVDGEEFQKEPNVIELKAYRDTWGKGLDSYLQWIWETGVQLRDLLAEDGALYVHLDWHVGHYVKVLLDEIFGRDNFRNEIVWHYPGREMHVPNKFNAKHDVILFYAKSDQAKIRTTEVAIPYDRAVRLKGLRRKVHVDDEGREWVWETRAQAAGQEPYMRYVDEIISKGRPLSDVWDDLQFLRGNHPERVDYATQKPSWLIERIIKASSDQGSLVLDCFAGSGTTAVVAESLGRRWVACDLSRFAIHTTRKRLLDMASAKPFMVQNLGKYERQLWQAAQFGEQAEAKQAAYRKLILDLYHATPVNGYAWLHGTRGGRMVHVGAVDSPVSLGDVTQIAGEFRRSIGTGEGAPKTNGVDVLGWDFAFEMNEVAKQKAAEAGIDVRFLRIPHDVMDKRARDQGDVRFFELAALSVDVSVGERSPSTGSGRTDGIDASTGAGAGQAHAPTGLTVTLTLKDFVIPPDDVPEDVQRAITKWEQWIDYWAVDWDNKGDTFHNEWQDYRTRKKRDLQKTISHTYETAGEYPLVVKVIDILGNDTTKTMRVKVG